ncbi:MAG: butyrate kinase [Kiritimatiellae bacterium]|nr:butyrate kinase [Kiritimatiellia bacterium]
MKSPLILTINPGSTTTKIAVYRGKKSLFDYTTDHPMKSLRKFDSVYEQAEYRARVIRGVVKKHDIDLVDIDIFVGRGGLLHPVAGGIYQVNDKMLSDLAAAKYGEHASNLGAVIAAGMAKKFDKNAYITNPVVVDELSDVARLTGFPGVANRSIFHALSQKAAGAKVAKKLKTSYNKLNLIVAHIGGGVSVGVHKKGKVIDVNNALDGNGPFSPERTGGVPLLPFMDYVRKNKISAMDAKKLVTKNGGLVAYTGTNNCIKIEELARSKKDPAVALAYEAFIYQIAKEIGAAAAALSGKVDAVILTGGVTKNKWFRQKLSSMVKFIAPVSVYTENLEMDALATAGVSVFSGNTKIKEYI